VVRARKARQEYQKLKENNAAIQIQRHIRGILARKWYKSQLSHVIFLQSCVRRRIARKELASLKAEAKSANHFKEVSYKLENKVVELTQTVTTLKTEKKELENKVSHFEIQIQNWSEKHEKMGKEFKDLESKLRESSVPQTDFDNLLSEKEKILSEHTATLKKMALLNSEMEELRQELKAEKEKVVVPEVPAVSNEEVTGLRSQISALKAQLAKSLHTRQQRTLSPSTNSTSRSISPAGNTRRQVSRMADESIDNIKPLNQTDNLRNRKLRRNSSAEVSGGAPKTSIDQIRLAEQLGGGKNPRPTSVGQSNTIAGGKSNRLEQISDDPEEEVIIALFFFLACS
jgi:myosin-5